MLNWVKSITLGALALLVYGLFQAVFGATTLLPNGEQCFQTGAGPVSSGSVYMLIPNTTTPKNTWQNSAQTVLNTNPIQLDANGCAIIYGTGSYRQQLYSGPVVASLPTGNLIYDLPTADTSSFQNVFWAGLAGGTPNAITITDPGFNSTDGSVLNFVALNSNTSSVTLSVSGGSPIAIEESSSTGPIALTSGCIVANNPVSVVFSSSANAFLLLTPCQVSSTIVSAIIPPPQGYLTLSSDTNNVIVNTDVSAATIVYYTPYVGNQVPIWTGSSFGVFTFSQLQLNLTASHTASTIFDVCVFLNSGSPALATGPAWSNSTAGASTRGSGAGTPQLQRQNGIWVNAVQITGLNGANTYTIPAEQCTYVGSLLIDGTGGQISAFVSAGQSRKWGVWNAYNKQKINLQVVDSTASWVYNGGYRVSNNNTANQAIVFTGLADDSVAAWFNQNVGTVANEDARISIGVNGTTGPGGSFGRGQGAITSTLGATAINPPAFGVSNFNEIEFSTGGAGAVFYGGQQMQMIVGYHG